MKQKLLLLMLLVAGLAACTKEVDGDINNLQSQIDIPWDHLEDYALGEYEGVWIVDKREIDTAKLTVTKFFFYVRFPEEFLINNSGYDIKEYKPTGELYQCMYSIYAVNGYSPSKAYFDFDVLQSSQFPKMLGDEKAAAEKYAGNTAFRNTTVVGAAYFDICTNLWTLKVTLDKAEQIGTDGFPRLLDITPITLVYIARKKISE